MPHYIFKAKKHTGEVYTGVSDAADRFEIYKMIHDSGDELISYKEKGDQKAGVLSLSISIGTGVKAHDKIIFARSLGSMIEAGLSVSHALEILERQTKNKSLKKIIQNVGTSISSGRSLSESLADHPRVFSSLLISMVKSGEQSGTLSQSLRTVAGQMDSSYSLQRKVKGAMTYPAIIFGVMIIIAILMLVYIVPTLTKTFSELNVDLPATTQLVIGTSNLLRNHGLLVLLGLTIVAGLLYFWTKQKSGKRIVHGLIIKIPLIGEIIREVNSARTARTLSSLISSGVDIVESIRITKDVIQNVHYKDILDEAEEAIKKGEQMSKVFNKYEKYYPIFVGEMIAVGEETGKIGEMLTNVATFYEDDVAEKTKDMSTIIEPILMVIIGAAVGFFALSMISPMYSLVNVI